MKGSNKLIITLQVYIVAYHYFVILLAIFISYVYTVVDDTNDQSDLITEEHGRKQQTNNHTAGTIS